MPIQYLDYQYIDGELSPYYFILKLFKGEVDWDKHTFYFDLIAPIKSEEYSKIDETLINCGVSMADLIINKEYPNRLGINLNSLKKRLSFDVHDPSVIEQFILYVPDVKEIIGQFPQKHRMEFTVSA